VKCLRSIAAVALRTAASSRTPLFVARSIQFFALCHNTTASENAQGNVLPLLTKCGVLIRPRRGVRIIDSTLIARDSYR
jgi:hypothetical protein